MAYEYHRLALMDCYHIVKIAYQHGRRHLVRFSDHVSGIEQPHHGHGVHKYHSAACSSQKRRSPFLPKGLQLHEQHIGNVMQLQV